MVDLFDGDGDCLLPCRWRLTRLHSSKFFPCPSQYLGLPHISGGERKKTSKQTQTQTQRLRLRLRLHLHCVAVPPIGCVASQVASLRVRSYTRRKGKQSMYGMCVVCGLESPAPRLHYVCKALAPTAGSGRTSWQSGNPPQLIGSSGSKPCKACSR
ncbi:hypothetical protein AOQ84DRAFT_45367 [Glonium stellatum]|uniref:Uncharacterized protein n=1 Tax=Glonium stellatum TaxID=574774 RepID=A0A8E2JSX8_9PEZI|nr:hypothetical protein AOQ84DRAFT_45367 [Glonium stellatum]